MICNIKKASLIFFYLTIFLPYSASTSGLENGLQLLQDFNKKYEISSCSELEKDEEEDEGEDTDTNSAPLCEDEFFYKVIQNECKSAKQSATKCCEDPNQCGSQGLDIAATVVAMAPVLMATKKGYSLSKKSNATNEDYCAVQNNLQMGNFGSSLLMQLIPLVKKSCSKKIAACKKTCSNMSQQIKADLQNILQVTMRTSNINSIITKAKNCLFGNPNESFTEITFESSNSSGRIKNAINTTELTCHWDGTSIQNSKQNGNSHNVTLENFLTKLLFVTKTYYNTLTNKAEILKFNEKEIIGCADQPDRILAPSNKPGSPVSQPLIKRCQQVVDQFNRRNPTAAPTAATPSSQPHGLGALTGGTGGRIIKKPPPVFSLLPADNDDIHVPPPTIGDFKLNKPPIKKVGSGNGKSPSPTAPGASGPPSSSGPGGVSPPNNPDEDDSPQYPNDISGTFTGSADTYSPDDSQNPENSETIYKGDFDEDDSDDGDKELSLNDEDNEGSPSQISIFDMASQRIQTFCSNSNCDK